MEPIPCVTVGWIIEKTKEKITIADSFTEDHDFGGVTSIPIEVVVEIFNLDSKSPMKYINSKPQEKKAHRGKHELSNRNTDSKKPRSRNTRRI